MSGGGCDTGVGHSGIGTAVTLRVCGVAGCIVLTYTARARIDASPTTNSPEKPEPSAQDPWQQEGQDPRSGKSSSASSAGSRTYKVTNGTQEALC